MTKERVADLKEKRGLQHLYQFVAEEFARTSGASEMDVINVLRNQENIFANQDGGRNRGDKSQLRACLALATGWESAENCTGSAAYVVSSYDLATAYAILVYREMVRRGAALTMAAGSVL